MKVFYDWEFFDTPAMTFPISLGMVAEDGREYYGVVDSSAIIGRALQDTWLRQNVFPHLPVTVRNELHADADGGEISFSEWGWAWDKDHPDFRHVKPVEQIQQDVSSFMIKSQPPELWAWYGAYDHVLLAKLYGSMKDYPGNWMPMWTNDLKQEAVRQGNPRLPIDHSQLHNALADARHNLVIARALDLL